MKSILIIIGFIPFTFTYSQVPDDEQIYKSIIDTIVKLHNFEFYNKKLQHVETYDYSLNPFDTITLFDPETYEDIVKSSLDFKIQFDSTNLHEAKLFKQRAIFPDGLYLIGKIKTTDLHKKVTLENYIDIGSYPNLQDFSEFPDSLFRYTMLGPYKIKTLTKENIATFKYAIKAFLIFSGVLWDKTNKYCLVESGYHYNIPDDRSDRGPSGGGFQTILENQNGKLKIIKFIGLWEE